MDFASTFEFLTGHPPFPGQEQLFDRLMNSSIPKTTKPRHGNRKPTLILGARRRLIVSHEHVEVGFGQLPLITVAAQLFGSACFWTQPRRAESINTQGSLQSSMEPSRLCSEWCYATQLLPTSVALQWGKVGLIPIVTKHLNCATEALISESSNCTMATGENNLRYSSRKKLEKKVQSFIELCKFLVGVSFLTLFLQVFRETIEVTSQFCTLAGATGSDLSWSVVAAVATLMRPRFHSRLKKMGISGHADREDILSDVLPKLKRALDKNLPNLGVSIPVVNGVLESIVQFEPLAWKVLKRTCLDFRKITRRRLQKTRTIIDDITEACVTKEWPRHECIIGDLRLTTRQLRIVELFLLGESKKSIASRLGFAPSTVGRELKLIRRQNPDFTY